MEQQSQPSSVGGREHALEQIREEDRGGPPTFDDFLRLKEIKRAYREHSSSSMSEVEGELSELDLNKSEMSEGTDPGPTHGEMSADQADTVISRKSAITRNR